MTKLLLIALPVLLAVLILRWTTGAPLRELYELRIAPMLCRWRPHVRSARSVRREGDGYVGRCRRCGVRLEKVDRDATWHVAQ